MIFEQFVEYEVSLAKIDYEIGNISRAIKPEKEKLMGYYPYIPMTNLKTLFYALSDIKKEQEKHLDMNSRLVSKFLDIGCGTGRILLLAKKIGIRGCVGIEYNQFLVDLAKKYHGFSDEEIICKDGFDLDREFLADFGYIYTYHPICDRNLMEKLHLHLVQNCIYDTIFYEMLPTYYPIQYSKENANLSYGKFTLR